MEVIQLAIISVACWFLFAVIHWFFFEFKNWKDTFAKSFFWAFLGFSYFLIPLSFGSLHEFIIFISFALFTALFLLIRKNFNLTQTYIIFGIIDFILIIL